MSDDKKFCEHCGPETGCHDPAMCEHFGTESCPINGVCVERRDTVLDGGLTFMGTRLLVAEIGRRFRKDKMETILADYPYLTERHVWFAAGYVTGRDMLWDKEKMIWGSNE
jgi:uncharacterized protein (DUF433 family)